MERIKKPLVFLVEDNPILSGLMANRLQTNSGCRTLSFGRAEDCLRAMEMIRPDLLLLDQYLHGDECMNGDQMLKELKSIGKTPPTIIVSAQRNISTTIDMLHYGAVDYLEKDSEEFFTQLDQRVHKVLQLNTELREFRDSVELKRVSIKRASMIVGVAVLLIGLVMACCY